MSENDNEYVKLRREKVKQLREQGVDTMLKKYLLFFATFFLCQWSALLYAKEQTLHVYCWWNYIPPEIIADFEKQYHTRVVYESYYSNEELIDKLLAGGDRVYDVIFPTDWYLDILMRLNKLSKLDKSLIPNWRFIKKDFLGRDFDYKNEYSLPYQWGVTVVAYRRDLVNIDKKDLSILFNPPESLRGRIGLINDIREIVGQALLYQHHSINVTNLNSLLDAQQMLLKIKPFVKVIEADVADKLVNGEILLAITWQGEALLAQRLQPNIEIYVPKEGAVIDYDTMAIPINAPNKKLAHQFINFLLSPEINAKVSEYTMYSTPVLGSLEYLSKNQIQYKDSETLIKENNVRKVEFIKDIGGFVSEFNKVWRNFNQL